NREEPTAGGSRGARAARAPAARDRLRVRAERTPGRCVAASPRAHVSLGTRLAAGGPAVRAGWRRRLARVAPNLRGRPPRAQPPDTRAARRRRCPVGRRSLAVPL